MWLSKFLDMTDDVKSMKEEIKNKIFIIRKEPKLTPLEFTILETIFQKEISGYDLIQTLNHHFAGTWEAKSGTIYPLLSKLKKDGFLNIKKVKSPIGPLKKVYNLTEAGEELLKIKINKNFLDQIQFIENFIIELSTIYIQSTHENKVNENSTQVQNILNNSFKNILTKIPKNIGMKLFCPECGTEQDNIDATSCSSCGISLSFKDNK